MPNEKLNYLISYLLSERNDMDISIPTDSKEKFDLYRSLVNIRPAVKASAEYLKAEDEFLQKLTVQKGITDIADLQPVEKNIYLWMTGYYHPCHNCIDNCIHTFAGVRLRLKCAEIMKAQGHEEPTGTAKITPAYDLPCDYVIHTVGPIVQGRLTEKHCELLKSCYQSCLELAVQSGIKSIAFCCISTGVFGFPQDKATEIAVQTVREFLLTHDIEVIFNVFTEKDYKIYSRLLG